MITFECLLKVKIFVIGILMVKSENTIILKFAKKEILMHNKN